MKNLIFVSLAFIHVFTFFNCYEKGNEFHFNPTLSQEKYSIFQGQEQDSKKKRSILTVCTQSINFTATLQTVNGGIVSSIQPNTNYRIKVQGPAYPGYGDPINVSYCLLFGYGFTPTTGCGDTNTSAGVLYMFITTNSTIPAQGLTAIIGPTDCSGSTASVGSFAKTFIFN